jgi:pyruvate formate lyase activating enzyme
MRGYLSEEYCYFEQMKKTGQKGVIFDIKRYALHDGPGIRTTVFFKGCPLHCWWCHNPEGILEFPQEVVKLRGEEKTGTEIIGRETTVDELMEEIEKEVVFYDQSGGGVTFSGGEPLMQHDFLREMLTACKQKDIHTAVDTSGYVPFDRIESIKSAVDVFLYDLKIMDLDLHQKYTGSDNHLIIQNLKMLDKRGIKTIIRFPIIPGITDTKKNVNEMRDFLQHFKNINEIDLLPYHRFSEKKYNRLNLEYKMAETNSAARNGNNDQGRLFLINTFESIGWKVNK